MSAWVDQMFAAGQVAVGGVVRRSVNDVIDQGAFDEIVQRAKDNGWHVIETGGQIVVLCHAGALVIHA
ncbi:hypothetical protein J2X55_002240 [Microbacterium sp. 1154]|uniref:hypothetical protein n=1 Tax=Microbacterium sp. 1154 TaxID=2817733 RepID=UPI0028658152|nr:hypothetical protein [Microbacterium sp. 1154]MDR6691328.1 hypothetical protein [Microbacterium sp. 1154]